MMDCRDLGERWYYKQEGLKLQFQNAWGISLKTKINAEGFEPYPPPQFPLPCYLNAEGWAEHRLKFREWTWEWTEYTGNCSLSASCLSFYFAFLIVYKCFYTKRVPDIYLFIQCLWHVVYHKNRKMMHRKLNSMPKVMLPKLSGLAKTQV